MILPLTATHFAPFTFLCLSHSVLCIIQTFHIPEQHQHRKALPICPCNATPAHKFINKQSPSSPRYSIISTMTVIDPFITIASPNNATLIGTTRGPNNTLIMTYTDRVTIFPQVSGDAENYQTPAQVYTLPPLKSRGTTTIASHPLSQFITKFTSHVFYHAKTEQFVTIADSAIIMTWPTLARAQPFDGIQARVFDKTSTESGKLAIHSIYPNPIDDYTILILDNHCRLHIYPIPRPVTDLLVAPGTNPALANTIAPAKTLLSPLNVHTDGSDKKSTTPPPTIHWSGLISRNHFLVATASGLMCYHFDAVELKIIDEIYYPHLAAALATKTTANRTTPSICNVSSYQYDVSTEKTPNLSSSAIPHAVLYYDGFFELFSFNLILAKFELLYSRRFSPSHVSQFSRVTALTQQHIAVITPTPPTSAAAGLSGNDDEEGKSSKDDKSKIIVLDLTYYTIDASKSFAKALPISTLTTPHQDPIFQNTFQLDTRQSTITTTFFIAGNALNVIKIHPKTPTLSSSIGSATRDAKFWSGVPLIATKANTGITEIKKTKPNDPTAHYSPADHIIKLKSKMVTQKLANGNGFIMSSIPTIALPVNQKFIQSKATAPGDQEVLLGIESKDAILALATKTLPVLNPFGTIATTPSFSNKIDEVTPPSSLLMQTASESTESLDTIILNNWSQYLHQCDAIEREALNRLLPRMGPYLGLPSSTPISTTTSTTTTSLPEPKKRNRRAINAAAESTAIPLSIATATTTETQTTLTKSSASSSSSSSSLAQSLSDLSPDVFLVEFFAHCAAWNDSAPSVTSLLPPKIANAFNQKQQQCRCSLHTHSPYNQDTTHVHKASGKKKTADTSATKSLKPQSIQLYQFVSRIVFEPCAWKALLGSTISLTGTQTSQQLLRSAVLFNSDLAQLNIPLLDKLTTTTNAPICANANKISIAKPLSPLFTHLVFRECVRRLSTVCCSNCPNMLYLLPIQILIANSLLSSALAVTCAKVALDKKLWGLVTAIVPAANISHSPIFFNLLNAVIEELAIKFETSLPAVLFQTNGVDSDEGEDVDSDSEQTVEEDAVVNFTQPKSKIDRIQLLVSQNDQGGFVSQTKCSCRATKLFSTSPRPYSYNYPNSSVFVAATLPQSSPASALYALLQAPITKPILVQQLNNLSFENVLIFLNLLTLILQSKLSQTPASEWLQCPVSTEAISTETLIMWVTMLIDSHAKQLLLSPHLLAKDQYFALDVFAALHTVLSTYCTQNPQFITSITGVAEQLTRLRRLGITKLSVPEPYTIQVLKF